MKAPLPPDEAKRLESLRRYDVLDTPPEQAFDDLTLLAAHICATPIALVSLIDEKRQWFKSRIGIPATETARDLAFCAHAILNADEVLEVRDARADPRFAENALVASDPHIRFYAGAPLIGRDGHALGSICVMDRAPRTLTAEEIAALRALSRRVVAQLELRRNARELAHEVTARNRAETLFRQQFEQLTASKHEADRLLMLADKSRRSLLSVLEDERLAGHNLRESEERFRQLAENIDEVFWMTDQAKNTMLYISPAYEKIWQRTCESLYQTPSNWLEAIHPDDRQRVADAAAVKQTRGDYDETYRIARPDGSLRWIRDRAFPIRDRADQVYRIVGTAEDITVRLQLDEQVRQAQKMDAIGTLAGGIAHDFNNIMTVIVGYVELIKMSVTDNPQLLEQMDAVGEASARAVKLVRQILTFSRREKPQRNIMQLGPVIEEALKFLRATIPSTIEFHLMLAGDTPMVLADATQIHQIVMNLGTNAWHAMKERTGRLEVKLENFEIDTDLAESPLHVRPGRYVRLSVSDTGTGMDKATIDRIFEPFFTTKAQGEGTGMGLAVVHGIMKSHDGAITVTSKLGEGTAFHLYFPAHVGELPEEEAQASPIPRGTGECILLVDDEESIVQLNREILTRLGYTVATQTSATEAIAQVRAKPAQFDLMIADLTMRGMTGIDFARQLAQIRPDLPIILVTGYPGSLTSEQVWAAGVRELLLKPATIQSLGTAVHRALVEKTPRKTMPRNPANRRRSAAQNA